MEIEQKSFDEYWYRSVDEWKEIINDDNAVVYIAEADLLEEGRKQMIGFSHNSIITSNGLKEGQYIRIAIDPTFRGAGIATLLTEKAFEYFKRNHVKKILLSTVADNKQLNDMYQGWGFELYDQDCVLVKKTN